MDKAVRRESFNQIADLYAEKRPGYPEKLIDDVMSLSNTPKGGRVLEIGCGPGTASVPFAERGCSMVCLELGEDLAAIARQRLARFSSAAVLTTRFEDWPLEPEAFDLVIAATSIHWVKREVAYSKSAAALRPGGSLAIFANLSAGGAASELQVALERLSARYLPGWAKRIEPRSKGLVAGIRDRILKGLGRQTPEVIDAKGDERQIAKIEESGFFKDIQVRHYPWTKDFDAEGYIQLMETFSDHQTLPPDKKEELYGQLRDLIRAHGGTVTRHYNSRLFLAKKA